VSDTFQTEDISPPCIGNFRMNTKVKAVSLMSLQCFVRDVRGLTIRSIALPASWIGLGGGQMASNLAWPVQFSGMLTARFAAPHESGCCPQRRKAISVLISAIWGQSELHVLTVSYVGHELSTTWPDICWKVRLREKKPTTLFRSLFFSKLFSSLGHSR
jgi:hypothetical protein